MTWKSSTITEGERHAPHSLPHSRRKILLEEFLKPRGITQYRLAREIGVSQRRIGEIVAGKRAVTAGTGLRLAQFFGTSEGFWTGLQDDHDRATTKDAIAATLRQITPWRERNAA